MLNLLVNYIPLTMALLLQEFVFLCNLIPLSNSELQGEAKRYLAYKGREKTRNNGKSLSSSDNSR